MRIVITTNKKPKSLIITLTITIILLTAIYLHTKKPPSKATIQFNGERAYQDAEYQLSLGPRTLGSKAHLTVQSWISSELKSAGWDVETPDQSLNDVSIHNIIGKRGEGAPWIILGAHYDSRFFSDRDPDPSLRTHPVPGANDGASGVAVLLELSRCLPKDIHKTIWLVFFDAEDNGNIPGYDWIMGSRSLADNLNNTPNQVIIIDMIGDKNLNIYQELNSDQKLTDSIWRTASQLNFNAFISQPKRRILDDHVPFLERAIPAVDIIDFDYPYWHTTQDTLDKISANSLYIVGETLRVWLLENND